VSGVSVLKVLGSEAEQNAARHALEAAGADGLRHPALTAPYNPYGPDLFTASWLARYISTYAGTIAGGTSEIQRNIIAQRVLGLPSGSTSKKQASTEEQTAYQSANGS
jgi:alkylation response protein AidB-like acyl-CoA dehydrogenase